MKISGKPKEILEKSVSIFSIYQLVVLVASIIFMIKTIDIVSYILLLVVIDIVWFFLCKDFLKNQKTEFTLMRLNIAVGLTAIINSFIKTTLTKVGGFGYALSVMIGILLVMVLFIDNKKKEKAIEGFSLIKGKGKDSYKEDTFNRYKLRICKDKETGEDVYIYGKDRQVHTLLLGPTGSGKTSSVIIPCIEQDIQHENAGITVIEPKSDLAEVVYAMGVYYDREVLYFNPTHPDCPPFNVLDGKEDEVIENLTTTFNMLSPDSKTYFRDINNNLIRKALMVLKRIEEAYRDLNTGISSRPATLITLSELIHNTEGKGRLMVKELLDIPTVTADEKKQNADTVAWFLNEYFSDKSKIYENASGIRTQISNLIQNKYLRRVLNPVDGRSKINFDKALETGQVIAITTAQGELRGLARYLGLFLILSYQSAVFKRKGDEDTRLAQYLYIDEFQLYANPTFADLLTMGRSYVVSCFIATQDREQITMGSGSDGKAFLASVSANARNVLVFAGASSGDAKYYSEDFGAEIKEEVRHGKSEQKVGLGNLFAQPRPATVSEQYSEKLDNIFSPTDITFREFKEITYKIVENGTVKKARSGITDWIDYDLNEELKRIYRGFREQQLALQRQAEEEEMAERQRRNQEFLNKKQQAFSSQIGANPTGENKPLGSGEIDPNSADGGWG